MGNLLGRERELHVLDELIDDVSERGQALVIRGQAGIGKSSLLAHTRQRARERGLIVLSAAGVQSEAHLPFAGLHLLLQPTLGDIADLPEPQRDALRAAFGMASAAHAPDLFVIALGVLNLLSGAAARTPLLVVVDDVQWLDRSTCSVLAFVARRIESDRIILLFALRDGFESAFIDAGLPDIHVEGLDEAAAATLLDAQAIPLDAAVRRRVLENAAGHPLALIELPVALHAETLGGGSPLPSWMPLTTRLERAFSVRANELPPTTRALLLIAAADDGDLIAEVLSAATILAEGTSVSQDALGPAIQAGLLDIDNLSVRFRHPLMRSALYQAAGAVQRRTAHASLAAVLVGQPDRAIWHRAAALVAGDEEVASDLAEMADRAWLRGANSVAAMALERAAQLSAHPARQGKWLLEAAMIASELDVEFTRRLLRAAQLLDLEPQQREELLWAREGFSEDGRQWTGVARVRPFTEMAERARLEGDSDRALGYMRNIGVRSFWDNPDQETRELVVATVQRIPAPDTHPELLVTLACTAPIECGAAVLERLSSLEVDTGNPNAAWLWGIAATAVGAFNRAAELLAPTIVALRTYGHLGMMAQALVSQALATRYTGNWAVALPAAEEASRLARETRLQLWAAAAQAVGAAVDGLRGETDRAEASAAEAERVLRAASANPMLALVQLARGATALSVGRYVEAFAQLWRVFDAADIAYHPVLRSWAVGDIVEAAVHSGHDEQAQDILREMESLAKRSPFPVLLAGLSLARPLLAADDAAEALFLAGLGTNLTELALTRERLQLAYGAWLRRHQRPTDARAPLRAAREGFDALGAAPWAERARQELRATGETSRRRETRAADLLTPQELQIALLAAEGLSNREIGQRLYLSHRTVSSHLYHIFPKLGVTSRAELSVTLGAGRATE